MKQKSKDAGKSGTDNGEILSQLLSLITEMLPSLFKKWSNGSETLQLNELRGDVERINQKLNRAEVRIRWLLVLLILALTWNIILTMLLSIHRL